LKQTKCPEVNVTPGELVQRLARPVAALLAGTVPILLLRVPIVVTAALLTALLATVALVMLTLPLAAALLLATLLALLLVILAVHS
jgi:hypothetical protein